MNAIENLLPSMPPFGLTPAEADHYEWAWNGLDQALQDEDFAEECDTLELQRDDILYRLEEQLPAMLMQDTVTDAVRAGRMTTIRSVARKMRNVWSM